MAGNTKSFNLTNVASKSFTLILKAFDYALTFLFRIKQKIQITFVSHASMKAISNIVIKKIKMTISSVKFLAYNLLALNLKPVRIVSTIREIGKIASAINIGTIHQEFVSHARQKIVSNIIIKKIKILWVATLGTFYTLASFDSETLSSLDIKMLAEMDGVSLVGEATISIATPAIVTLNSHGLTVGERVYISTTGALPTGLTASVYNATSVKTIYYVIEINANTFNLALSYADAIGGVKINTTGSQSGVHTVYTF